MAAPISRPPDYETSSQVRTGISHAYSGTFNPRGLEKPWYGPYGHMFCDLTSSYDGHLIAQCQYPLFIPALKALELKLRQDFISEGLDYDIKYVEEEGEENTSNNDDGEDILAALSLDHDQRKKSKRLAERERNERLAAMEEGKKTLMDLLKRKSAIADMAKALDNQKDDPDVSLQSAATQPDANAINEEPDFVLSHIAHHPLPPLDSDTSEEEKRHYDHRAGIKVTHECCLLIAELKSGAPRFYKTFSKGLVENRLYEAKRDLMEYCSAYFNCHAKPDSVIAFAAAGPFWTWANIQRHNVPEFDWRTKTLVEQSEHTAQSFALLFLDYHTLGTHESDRELTKINQLHIRPMLSHAPSLPPT